MSEPNEALGDLTAIVDRVMEIGEHVAKGGGVPPVQVTACEDWARVTAVPPGELKIEITDVRALRLGREEIAKDLTRAANQALTGLRASMGANRIDPDAMAESFKAISERGRASFATVLDSVVALQRPEPS